MKDDKLVPLLLLCTGIMATTVGILLVMFGYWLASVL